MDPADFRLHTSTMVVRVSPTPDRPVADLSGELRASKRAIRRVGPWTASASSKPKRRSVAMLPRLGLWSLPLSWEDAMALLAELQQALERIRQLTEASPGRCARQTDRAALMGSPILKTAL